ncbi:MAG TPA: anti-sigma factor [Burkholderiales bacterium]|nr:anti-sigma factor [Burkholderiales bacterium]
MNCRGKPERRRQLAAEYVLGTLRGRARERLRRWLRDDAELAREVAQWEARLLPMAEAVQPVTPPARVWTELERRIDGSGRKRSSIWKALALVTSGAVAALLVVAVLFRPGPATVPGSGAGSGAGSYIAVLSDPKTNRPVLVAAVERGETVLRVNTLDPAIHVSGRSLELWALPPGAKPKSLGVLASTERGSLKLAAAADQTLGDVPALAVSLEPPGGSPTGQPTGPVLYTGPCVRSW